MKRSIRQILTAAVVTVPVIAGLASAQQRIDRSGALDANNRVGSGGRNEVSSGPKPWQIANDIALGNISGGFRFRDNVTQDPNRFHGNLGNNLSNRVARDSASVMPNGAVLNNASRAQPFYGNNQLVPPPAGFTQVLGTGAYVPPTQLNSSIIDPRIGSINDNLDVVTPARPGQFLMPGPVDSAVGPTNPVLMGPANDVWSLSNFTQLNRATRTGTTDQDTLDQIRKDLQAPADDKTAEPRPGSFDDQLLNPQISNTVGTNTVGTNSVGAGTTAMSNAVTDQTASLGLTQRLLLPAKQSTVYAALQKRREEQEKVFKPLPGQAAEDAARDFNAQLRARGQGNGQTGNNQPGNNQPGNNPAGGVQPGGNVGGVGGANNGAAKPGDNTGVRPSTPLPPPVRIDTLKGSDSSAALSKLMGEAESLMREGKYSSAIEKYDRAAREAPNNKLIQLGQANAELGGQYYRRAEASLRGALGGDKNLLAGQYDLKKFLGEERLAVIEADLRDQVNKKDKDVGPALLLAYLYYNTGNERRAAALLDLADQRAKGQDMFVKTLQQNWVLNPDNKPSDNK